MTSGIVKTNQGKICRVYFFLLSVSKYLMDRFCNGHTFQGMEESEPSFDHLDYGLAMYVHPSLLYQSHNIIV